MLMLIATNVNTINMSC